MKHLLLLIAVLGCISVTPSLSQEGERQSHLWLEADVLYRMSPKTRFLGVVEVDQDRFVGARDLFLGAFVDFGMRPILRPQVTEEDFNASPLDFLRLRVGAAYLTSLDAENPSPEIRGVVDLTPRYRFGGLLLAFRNRTEYRLLKDLFVLRYRGRLWLEYSLYSLGTMPVTPFAATEIYWQDNQGGFFRLRSHVGIALGVTSWFGPDIRYVYQSQWNNTGRDLEAFYVTLTFYL